MKVTIQPTRNRKGTASFSVLVLAGEVRHRVQLYLKHFHPSCLASVDKENKKRSEKEKEERKGKRIPRILQISL
jgi:hypothetical protein